MSPAVITLLMIIGLFGGLASGIPIAFVLMGIGVIFGFIFLGAGFIPLYMSKIWGTIDSWEFICVPMFVLMGNFLSGSGITEGLFRSFRYLLGPVKGGLGLAVLLVSIVFAACTAVMTASVSAMTLLAGPTMIKSGYSRRLTLGIIMGGGTLGILIPPSIMLVVMGTQGGISIGKLIMGALTPGIALGLLYMVYVAVYCQLRPAEGPPMSAEERGQVSTGAMLKDALKNLVPVALLITGVLGSIFGGVATPTEASGVGAFVAFLLVVGYRKLTWKLMRGAVEGVARLTGMMLLMMVGAGFFSATFAAVGGSDVVKDILTAGGGKWVAFALMILILYFMSFFLDWVSSVFITFPVFIPIAKSLGFDPVWFTLVLAVSMQAAFLNPIIGFALFILRANWSEISHAEAGRACWPFVSIIAVMTVLVIIFPNIILWLPNLTIK